MSAGNSTLEILYYFFMKCAVGMGCMPGFDYLIYFFQEETIVQSVD